jgi:AcrR family transcriptional regulator
VAWNTEETRRRLKEAAVIEFAAEGLAGARMDRIAERAGLNKERLYKYFGDKERLFGTVLADEMAKIAEAIPPETLQEVDIGEYVGRCYDYHVAHPHLTRLLHWEALAYGEKPVPDEESRIALYRRKVGGFDKAQRDGVIDPKHLVFLAMAMASWWDAVPQVARMITGESPVSPEEHARRRATVVEAARRLAGTTSGK